MTFEIVWQSIVAGLATVLGAIFVTILGSPGEKTLAGFLGFAGGVMSAVIIFDLIPSALDYGNVFTSSLGFLLGLIIMLLLDVLISIIPGIQKNPTGTRQVHLLKMGYLIAVGIALHDLPEGIAIAVGYTAKESLGLLIALSIGLHNIPEGMATAAPLKMGGMSTSSILGTCMLISVFTPLGALMGIYLVTLSPHFICLLLALAGGAMAFIVKNELIPESYRHHPNYARLGFICGLLIILALGFLHH